MNIQGLDKAAVLAALFNASKQQGMGRLNSSGVKQMTVEDARDVIAQNSRLYFEYLRGRVMKIDLSEDEMETRLYNRDNGDGAAERAVLAMIEAS